MADVMSKENPRQTRTDAFDQIYPALLGSCASYASLEYLDALESQITEWLRRVREQQNFVVRRMRR